MEPPPYLVSIYKTIERSFGRQLTQHQYEGLLVLLYAQMSDRNIGKLLSLFMDKPEFVITAEVSQYIKTDKAVYEDVKERLDKNGFSKWVSSFDFQVENYFFENLILYVEGRLIEGELVRIGDKVNSMKTFDKIESVNMWVVSIEMYDRQLEFLDLGMTGRLGLKVDKTYTLGDRLVLSSEEI